ncbi:hypothetical protein Hanom_Chr09g00779681 [Helianthus anomalus]
MAGGEEMMAGGGLWRRKRERAYAGRGREERVKRLCVGVFLYKYNIFVCRINKLS